MNTSIATKSVTNTQLIIATFIMFGAGSVALATVPLKQTEVCQQLPNGVKIVDKYGIRPKSKILTNGCQVVGQNNKKQDLTFSCVKRNSPQYNVSAKECVKELPDLWPESINFVPDTAGNLMFTLKYINKGTASIGPFNLSIYFRKSDLSHASIPTGPGMVVPSNYKQEIVNNGTNGEILIATLESGFNLQPGATAEFTGWVPKSVIKQGANQIGITLNSPSGINKIDELQYFNTIFEKFPLPDVTNNGITFTPQPNGDVKFEFEYINKGGSPVMGPFGIAITIASSITGNPFFFDKNMMNAILDAGYPKELSSNNVAVLIKYTEGYMLLSNLTKKIVGTIPASLIKQGANLLTIHLDYDNNINELNEGNNVYYKGW